MKKTILSLMLMVAFLPPFTASGQTYYDFALATDGAAATTSNSIIRAVGNDKALVYYETATKNYIAHIDTYGSVNRISLPTNYKVWDMRYCNNKVYICGTHKNKAFLYYIPYNEVATSSVVAGFKGIKCNNLVSLNRMVAFKEPILGIDKIIAVGEDVYQPCQSGSGYNPYYSCADRYVLECECQSGNISINTSRQTNDASNQEYITEVIETATCVALVGYHADLSALTIHRCMKGPNMLMYDFDNFFYYPGTDWDGLSIFHGCPMKDDTIAIASLSLRSDSPVHLFETRIRTIDLQSMAMTTSQAIDLGDDKAEPEELVYLPQYQTLVMLQDFSFPTPSTGPGYNYAFLHLKPYNPITYTANGVVEINSLLPYRSVDLLFGEYYISTGGNYWLMKDALQDVAPTNCYDCGGVIVDNINRHPPKSYYFPYLDSVTYISDAYMPVGNSQTMYPQCINQ